MRRRSISALKALLLSKSGGHCGSGAGDAARIEVRFSQAPPQASGAGAAASSLLGGVITGRGLRRPRAQLSRAEPRSPGWDVRGQRRLQQPGVLGVPRLPARRSPGRGRCRSCGPSPRARPPRSPAPAAAKGRLAWRGPGGARGGRLHRVSPSTAPRLRPAGPVSLWQRMPTPRAKLQGWRGAATRRGEA